MSLEPGPIPGLGEDASAAEGGDDPAAVAAPDLIDEVTLEDYYDNAPCGYLSLSSDGRIVGVNQTFLDWTAYPRETLLAGKRFSDLLSAGGRIYYETHCAPLLLVEGSIREVAFDVRCADGHTLPVLFGAEARHTPDGRTVFRATVFDATHRRSYERQLLRALDEERAARQEAEASLARLKQTAQPASDLSGLPNRRWWKAMVAAELREARRSDAPLVLALVEIDHFDRYSVLHGHPAADQLLLQVTDIWRRAGYDLMARHDGEAFGAPLPGVTLAEATQLVDRLRRGSGAATNFSVGLAEWDRTETGDELGHRAERALADEKSRRG